jgi:ferredoxin
MGKLITLLLIFLLVILTIWVALEKSLFPRKSTVAFWRLSKLPLTKKIEGFFYAARPAWYLKPASWPWFIKHFGSKESGDTYHAKLITCHDAGKLIKINQPVNLTNLEHVIPYPVARSIILQDPLPSIAVMDCPCRLQQKNPCAPIDVCLIVGEPFASFVVEHQSTSARRINVQEALDIIEGEENRGHIHTAWFKDVMHNRFYAICNCCTCCCLGMKSFFRGVKRIAHSGYRPVIDYDLCTGCGTCLSICAFKAVQLNDELPEFNTALCLGCGLCVSHCPNQALTLGLAPDQGVPLDIHKLVN